MSRMLNARTWQGLLGVARFSRASLALAVAGALKQPLPSLHSDYLLGISVDDEDDLAWAKETNEFTAWSDGRFDQNVGSGGIQQSFPNVGWVTLVTAPSQASGKAYDGSAQHYQDTKVYAKALGSQCDQFGISRAGQH